jgi:hypothetical protein
MPTTNEDFFSREQMQNMAMGLGQGLQGRDFASSFGAALSGTVGADLLRQQRREERQQRLEDLDEIEKRQIRAEERQRGYAVKDREDLLKYYKQMRVATLDRGRAKPQADWKAFGEFFAKLFGGKRPRFKGNSPISLYDESMRNRPSETNVPDVGPAAPAVKTNSGDPDLWDQEMDAVDPYAREIMQGVR